MSGRSNVVIKRDDTAYRSRPSAGTTRGKTASPARPDVEHVAIAGAEIVDPAQRCFGTGAFAFAIDRNQCGLDVRLHLSAVAADVNDRAFFNQAPDPVLLRGDQILHIGLWALGAR